MNDYSLRKQVNATDYLDWYYKKKLEDGTIHGSCLGGGPYERFIREHSSSIDSYYPTDSRIIISYKSQATNKEEQSELNIQDLRVDEKKRRQKERDKNRRTSALDEI